MKVKVYDENGKEHLVEAVDAREYIESGSYTKEDPNTPAKPVPAKPAAPAPAAPATPVSK